MCLATIYTDFMNMAADFQKAMGAQLTYAEFYRPMQVQNWRWAEHQASASAPLAAFPGTSNHGWGLAVDLRNGIGDPTSSTFAWMANNATKYGFTNDVNSEDWHWHHPSATSITKPRDTGTTTASTGGTTVLPTPPKGNSDMFVLFNKDTGWYALASTGYIFHLGSADDAALVAKVTSATDEIHSVTAAQWATLLTAFGIESKFQDPHQTPHRLWHF